MYCSVCNMRHLRFAFAWIREISKGRQVPWELWESLGDLVIHSEYPLKGRCCVDGWDDMNENE